MDNLYSSFYLYKKYEIIGDELIDLGITSVDADGTQEPVVKSECDPACGCPEPIYRWVQTEDTVCVGEEPAVQYRWTPSGWTCVGYDKYQNNIKEQSLDEGLNWTVVIPEEYSASTLIEADSPDCGYVPPTPASPKFILTLNDSSTVSAECDSSSAITESEVSDYSSSAVSVVIGDCVTTIDDWTFGWWSNLTSVTISENVTSIGTYVFLNDSNLLSVTCLATTPPTLGGASFENTNNCPIYVPCESVSAYQAAEGWSDYASRIQALTTPGDYDGIYRGMLSNGTFYHILRISDSKLTSGNVSSHREDTVTSNIGTGVTEIDDNTFSGFTMLKEANIASTVTSIGNNAFKDCPQMNIIRVNATTPPTLGSNAFDGTNNCLIQVPCGYASTFKSASGWSTYASRII